MYIVLNLDTYKNNALHSYLHDQSGILSSINAHLTAVRVTLPGNCNLFTNQWRTKIGESLGLVETVFKVLFNSSSTPFIPSSAPFWGQVLIQFKKWHQMTMAGLVWMVHGHTTGFECLVHQEKLKRTWWMKTEQSDWEKRWTCLCWTTSDGSIIREASSHLLTLIMGKNGLTTHFWSFLMGLGVV